jgi:hypothetical protein
MANRSLKTNCVASGKKRQVEATNCDKFIAAFCRFLSLGFEPHFSRTISLGDGVLSQNLFLDGSY